ncbi:MAG: type 12 methyltransferase [Candidatus Woesebacteria bacterium GW2011_GWA1_39_12]|uniref:Type 12 methyltransferase n=1 Tax=Candidatus Woesebacteria bacterium GW2011_GWA1_39_12 TaxID=1618549 RepID=A0A0G0PJ95_9BACT|nr:MAG: type 12 methyltransferase [Candidatus Woesebacteria bacterium GW2011_GWA1_39_12]
MIVQEKSSLKLWKKFYRLNNYYHKDIQKLVSNLIPKDLSVIEIEPRGGELLSSLPNIAKAGVYIKNFSQKKMPKVKYDYVILSNTLSEVDNIQDFIKEIKKVVHENTRVVVIFFDFFWKPILDLGEKIGLKLPQVKEPNWLSEIDVDNFFFLEGFEKIKSGKRFLIPYKIPYLSDFINRYLAPLPLINSFCLTNFAIYKPVKERKEYSVSIIIPARNEEGNMKGIFEKIPELGKKMEIIFVEGHSKDNTYKVIQEEIKKYKGPIKASLYKQKGKGKGDAVRLGFSKAKNELLIILDADLTVEPKELPKFYEVAALGLGDLVNGSRLVYPMEKQAMRVLNYLGNKFFSAAFTFLLGQKIKDTLCGTKVILKENYQKIEKNRKLFGNFDPFGDFDLIFGASKLNLKIIEIPIRYKERSYGKTNISRSTHGWLLLKMVGFAAKNLKFK